MSENEYIHSIDQINRDDILVANNTDIAGPMTVGGGSTPASTLWWDGFTVSKNISDADAEP